MEEFNKWFNEVGYSYYDEIIEYLYNCPSFINLKGDIGIYNIEEFAYTKCEDIFENMIGDCYEY